MDDILFTEIGVYEASTPGAENVAGLECVTSTPACVQDTPEEVEETSLLLWLYSRQYGQMGFMVNGSLKRLVKLDDMVAVTRPVARAVSPGPTTLGTVCRCIQRKQVSKPAGENADR